jgi:hypothetical protein
MPSEVEVDDLRQIGLTVDGKIHLESVVESGWFEDRQDAYKVAIAVALSDGIIATPEQVRGAVTAYNFLGGLDRDGRLKSLIELYRPEDARWPARTAERLAHAGLAVLAERLRGEDQLLSEVFGYVPPEEGTERPTGLEGQ